MVLTAPRRVVIFRSQLLPLSQTFVREQAAALREWAPLLMGFESLRDGLSLNGLMFEVVHRGGRIATGLRAHFDLPQPQLTSALKRSGAELAHVHFGTDATDSWPAIRSAGLPMVVTLHGYDIRTYRQWWESGHGGRARRTYPSRLLTMARDRSVHFIAVSGSIRQRAIEFGVPAEKLSVAHIGVDTERFSPGGPPLDRRRRRILYVGRMVEKKAPLLLIQAFSKLRVTIPDAELVMIGDGPLLAAATRLAHDLQTPVEFLGARTSSQVLEQLGQARVFCLPSVTAANGDAEGLPIALLEAQACGVPVVTSAGSGSTEGLLDGLTGHAFPEGDLLQLADRLQTWLLDDALARAASSIAPEFVRQNFDIRQCTRQLEAIYDQVAAGTT